MMEAQGVAKTYAQTASSHMPLQQVLIGYVWLNAPRVGILKFRTEPLILNVLMFAHQDGKTKIWQNASPLVLTDILNRHS